MRSVGRLKSAGFSLEEIGDMTLDQFQWHLEAVEENEARGRIQWITDMNLCISSALVEDSGIETHLDIIRLQARGA